MNSRTGQGTEVNGWMICRGVWGSMVSIPKFNQTWKKTIHFLMVFWGGGGNNSAESNSDHAILCMKVRLFWLDLQPVKRLLDHSLYWVEWSPSLWLLSATCYRWKSLRVFYLQIYKTGHKWRQAGTFARQQIPKEWIRGGRGLLAAEHMP